MMGMMELSCEKTRDDLKVKTQQLLRLRRQGIAMASYIVVIFSLLLTDTFGFGRMSRLHWQIGIAMAVIGNALFFTLIISNRNLRFKDPSLTWAQILYAGVILMFILHAVPEMRSTIMMFFIPAFSFGMLRLPRGAYLSLVACVMGLYVLLMMLEYRQDRPGFELEYELFLFTVFGIVLTWFAVFGGFISNIRRRLKVQTEAVEKANEEIRLEIEERRKAQIEKDKLIVELRDALSKVKTLSGLVPICASCKKIRDDKGYWNQLELYLSHHTGADFTHGICPECSQKALDEAFGKPHSE